METNYLLTEYCKDVTLERKLSPRSVELWSRYVDEFLQSGQSIDADGVRNWLMSLGHNSAQTLKGKLSGMKSFAGWAFGRSLISELEKGRIKELRGPRIPKRLVAVISPEQVDQLIETPAPPKPKNGISLLRWDIRELRDSAFIELGYATGLRVAELSSLNFDLCAYLRGALDEGLMEFPVVGKGNKEALVLAGRKAIQALDAYLKVRSNFGHPRTGYLHPTALFVGIRFGDRLSTNEARKILKRRGQRAGIPHVHPHMLRHCLASHLHKMGASLPTIQQILRHENLSSTAIYIHTTSKEVAAAYRKHFPRA